MKAWKGHTTVSGRLIFSDGDELPPNAPVLVLDASEFPEDYPEIGSEWLWEGEKGVIAGPPYKRLDVWCVPFRMGESMYRPPISDLKPLPKTVTGEVVASVVIDSERSVMTPPDLPEGTYDIVRRS